MVLIRNVLLARDPIYGVGEWAAGCVPELLGLTPCQVALLNDGRADRCVVKLCQRDDSSLTLALATHVGPPVAMELHIEGLIRLCQDARHFAPGAREFIRAPKATPRAHRSLGQ